MKKKDSEQAVTEIYINRAMCVLWGDVIVSLNRYHLKFCKCGSIHVDGGSAYLPTRQTAKSSCGGQW